MDGVYACVRYRQDGVAMCVPIEYVQFPSMPKTLEDFDKTQELYVKYWPEARANDGYSSDEDDYLKAQVLFLGSNKEDAQQFLKKKKTDRLLVPKVKDFLKGPFKYPGSNAKAATAEDCRRAAFNDTKKEKAAKMKSASCTMAAVLELRKKSSVPKTEVQELLIAKLNLESVVQDKIKTIKENEKLIQDLKADVCIYKAKYEKADELNQSLQGQLIKLIDNKFKSKMDCVEVQPQVPSVKLPDTKPAETASTLVEADILPVKMHKNEDVVQVFKNTYMDTSKLLQDNSQSPEKGQDPIQEDEEPPVKLLKVDASKSACSSQAKERQPRGDSDQMSLESKLKEYRLRKDETFVLTEEESDDDCGSSSSKEKDTLLPFLEKFVSTDGKEMIHLGHGVNISFKAWRTALSMEIKGDMNKFVRELYRAIHGEDVCRFSFYGTPDPRSGIRKEKLPLTTKKVIAKIYKRSIRKQTPSITKVELYSKVKATMVSRFNILSSDLKNKQEGKQKKQKKEVKKEEEKEEEKEGDLSS